jgi:prolyl-tRNA editing enzyme YbaK/EbsC (Cys-tRNA(Pro) deacylase)
MVQYVAKIHTEKLNKIIRVWQQNHSHNKASKQHFHFRLADENVSAQLTGYEHNAVIPILMKTK